MSREIAYAQYVDLYVIIGSNLKSQLYSATYQKLNLKNAPNPRQCRAGASSAHVLCFAPAVLLLYTDALLALMGLVLSAATARIRATPRLAPMPPVYKSFPRPCAPPPPASARECASSRCHPRTNLSPARAHRHRPHPHDTAPRPDAIRLQIFPPPVPTATAAALSRPPLACLRCPDYTYPPAPTARALPKNLKGQPECREVRHRRLRGVNGAPKKGKEYIAIMEAVRMDLQVVSRVRSQSSGLEVISHRVFQQYIALRQCMLTWVLWKTTLLLTRLRGNWKLLY